MDAALPPSRIPGPEEVELEMVFAAEEGGILSGRLFCFFPGFFFRRGAETRSSGRELGAEGDWARRLMPWTQVPTSRGKETREGSGGR